MFCLNIEETSSILFTLEVCLVHLRCDEWSFGIGVFFHHKLNLSTLLEIMLNGKEMTFCEYPT